MRLSAVLSATNLVTISLLATSVFAQTANHPVISEVYGGGGNSGSTYKNDFVELYNPTSSPVSLSGWSVQYASSTGSSWQVTNLSGFMVAHGFYLVQEAQGAGGTTNLPTPDAIGTISMSSTNGKVALVNTITALSGTNPVDASIVDKVGFGTATGFEGTGPAPAPSNSSSIERKAESGSTAASLAPGGSDANLGNGYDSDDNAFDFVVQTSLSPQNSMSQAEPAVRPTGAGIGTAQIAPSILSAGSTSDFTIKFVSNETDTIHTVIVVVPAAFSWPMNISSLATSGTGASGAVLNVDQDTIYIGSAAITSTDTAQLVIHSVTAPDSAMSGNFIVKTAIAGIEPSQITSQLIVSVTKLVRVIDLHANNSQGEPAAPHQVGNVVTVSGIITADMNPTRTDLYLQDETAGINIFSSSRSYDYQVGDSVTFTGTIDQYRGTTEIVPDSDKIIVYSHGNPLPEPMVLTAADVNQTFSDDYSEPNEGRLVRINGVTYAGGNMITDATGSTGGYLGNLAIPPGTFDLVGILKQYKPGTPAPPAPYTADYEIQARAQDDIIFHPGPVFVEAPVEEDIQPNSVTINLATSTPSSVILRYGATSAYTDSVVVTLLDTVHSIRLDGLWPATVYHYQIAATDPAGTNQTGDAILSTASPAGTIGRINVYFSKSVDTAVARGENAQTVDISSKFISRIDSARHSIDVALYSLSGNVGNSIAFALISAKNRGVKIRMIVENDNSNTAPMNTMKSSGIPFITDAFDPLNAGYGLMHNKFAVFDYRDTSSFTDDWVWTGSWNATDPGNNSDAQNVLEIQDKSLANAFTMEFNEMWGSSTDAPNSIQSRFGIRKTDNTPHKFNINGTPVELYFSPSDQTTLHIYEELDNATHSIDACMLTFTRADLAEGLIAKKSGGGKVRVIMDNNTDTGSQFDFLKNGGVDVHLKGNNLAGLLHHKYALIDAENPEADDIVITGSHNWSNSAETTNNENTLFIHSARIANLYLQEFSARYIEAGGTDIPTGVKSKPDAGLPTTFSLRQNFPNPFNPTTAIGYQLSAVGHVTLRVYDVLGREVATLVNERQKAGYYSVTFDGKEFTSGVYFCALSAGGRLIVKKMLLMK